MVQAITITPPVNGRSLLPSKLNGLVLGILFATAINVPALPTDGASEETQQTLPGVPGVAAQRAVVNFSDLPRTEFLPRTDGSADDGQSAKSGVPKSVPLSPQVTSTFAGLVDDTLQAPPSDTHGAVGPNHLMEVSNSGVHIQTRSGQVISTVLLSSFWSKLGPFDDFIYNGTNWGNVYDTKVVYDHFENRWMFTTLAFGNGASLLLLGVSQTSDPTGNWNLYRIDADPTRQARFDHPDVGFNKDWIVASGFTFRLSDGRFVRSDTYVFNKTNCYAGGAGLYTLFQRTDSGLRNLVPAITFDNTLSTMYLLGAVMPCCTDAGFTNLSSLRLYTITGPVGSEVFSVGPTMVTTNRWDNFIRFGNRRLELAPQLGSANKFTIVEGLMRSLIYRNGSLWAAHDGFVPAGGSPDRSVVFWYQISTAGGLIQQGRIDNPIDQTFYAYSSLAVNRFDDVLTGYSRFASNQYVRANYSFRAASDPPNTLRTDTVLKSGEAPYYVETPNRWADTSATAVDPNNDFDFWTIQTYAASPLKGKDRWGTWWGKIAPLRVLAVTINGSNALIRFTTQTNQSYRVERAGSFSPPIVWESPASLTNVVGTGFPVEVTDTVATNRSQQFYRVRFN